ncbi:MAG: ADP-ribosylglycohydrolase family protein [Verrucomicrobiota bacterium]
MNQTRSITKRDRVLGGLWGSLVGDALGVPVEFKDRATVQIDPVREMRGFGSHKQPAGTWSDDGALTLCTVESLLHSEFDVQDMGRRFARWMNEEHWTATGVVFDVGGTTANALLRIAQGIPASEAGGRDEHSNGNGSLMRTLPIALRFFQRSMDEFISRIECASAITHAHARSKMACVLHGLIARKLLEGKPPESALHLARIEFSGIYQRATELAHFHRLLKDELVTLRADTILSTGYVLHTLHASLWCLLTTTNFKECVQMAVNLGGDTDTTGCVAGGLAGVVYGACSIPPDWLQALARRKEVEDLLHRFAEMLVDRK